MAHPQRVDWLWKANIDPWSQNEPEEWRRFSDVEVLILEEAFERNDPKVLLDDYHVDLTQMVQISNNDVRCQRPIKRVMEMDEMKETKLREERFLPNPISPSHAFAGYTYTWGGHFCHKASEDLHCDIYDIHTNDVVRQTVVDKAIDGLLIEGKIAGKQREAERMAQELSHVKHGTSEELWRCCARLYAMESFLYKKLNETMRLQEDEEHKALWRRKVTTFGPFALLLCIPEHRSSNQPEFVYRSAQLSDDLIEQFRILENCGGRLSFPAFTSTSRNRAKAEFMDSNVLFIIKVDTDSYDFITYDISPYSNFDEEEQLLQPSAGFQVASCTFDSAKNKWEICLIPDDL